MKPIYLTVLLLSVLLILPLPWVPEAGADTGPQLVMNPPDQDANKGGRGWTSFESDWYVHAGDSLTYRNQTIFMGGKLQVNNTGSLTLENCTLVMNCTYDGEFNILVMAGGDLVLKDLDGDPNTDTDMSAIISSTDHGHHAYSMFILAGASFSMDSAVIERCGFTYASSQVGLLVATNNVYIENSAFFNCFIPIYFNSVTGGYVNNTYFQNYLYGIVAASGSGSLTLTNLSFYNGTAGVIMDTSSNIEMDRCFVELSDYGIHLTDTTNVLITNNTIYTSTVCGVNLTGTSDHVRVENNTISCYVNTDQNEGVNSWNVYDVASGTDKLWRYNFYGDYEGMDTDGDMIGDRNIPGTSPYPYNRNGVIDVYPVCADITNDNPAAAGYHYANPSVAVAMSLPGNTVSIPEGRFHDTLILTTNVSIRGEPAGTSQFYGPIIMYDNVTANISRLEFGFVDPEIPVGVFLASDTTGAMPRGCRIHNNTFLNQYLSVVITAGENNTVENNYFDGAQWAMMIEDGANNNTFRDNVIENTNIGLGLSGNAGSPTGNRIIHNSITENTGVCYYSNNARRTVYLNNYGASHGFCSLYINNSRHVSVDGGIMNGTSSYMSVQVQGSMDVFLNHTTMNNTVAFADTHYSGISDSHISDHDDIGIYSDESCVSFRLERSVLDCEQAGAFFNGTSALRVVDCTVHANNTVGMSFENNSDTAIIHSQFTGDLEAALSFKGACMTRTMNNTFALDNYTRGADLYIEVGDVISINDTFTKVNITGDPDVACLMAMNWLKMDARYALNGSVANGASVNISGNGYACGCTPNRDFHNYTIGAVSPVGPAGMPYAIYNNGVDNLTWTTTHISASVTGDVSDTDGPRVLDMNTSHTEHFLMADVWAPGAPSGLVLTPLSRGNALNISWKGVSDAAGYSILNNHTGSWVLVTNVTDTPSGNISYVHDGLVDGDAYYYRVLSFDQVPLDSGYIEGSGTPADTLAPAAPAGLTVVAVGSTYINVSWEPVPAADITGYHVLINDSEHSRLVWTNNTTDSFLNISGLEAETTYHVRVEAYDEVPNTSPLSPWLNVSTAARPVVDITLRGQILDNTTGEPIPDASVSMSRFSVPLNRTVYVNTSSDAAGNFTVVLGPGSYNVSVTASGYHDLPAERMELLTPGTAEHTFRLDPWTTGIIFGRVTSDGTGVEGATVVVLDTSTNGTYHNATTNSTGHYSIELAPGIYRAYVSADGYEKSAPTLVDLGLSDMLERNFVLNTSSTGRVSGTVSGAGIRIDGALIGFYDEGGTLVTEVTTQSDGNYSVKLAPGNYSVHITYTGFSPRDDLNVVVEKGITTVLNITLEAIPTPTVGSISGTVTDTDTDEPLEGVDIIVSQGGSEVARTTTDTSGNYTLQLQPGSYHVHLELDGYEEESSNVSVGPGTNTSLNFHMDRTTTDSSDGGISSTIWFIISLVALLLVIIIVIVVVMILLGRRGKDESKDEASVEDEVKPSGEASDGGGELPPGEEPELSEDERAMEAGDIEDEELDMDDMSELKAIDDDLPELGDEPGAEDDPGEVEVDEPGGEIEVDEPGGEVEVDEPDSEVDLDEPDSEVDLDEPDDEIELDGPDDEIEFDGPDDEIEFDEPDDEIEFD